MLNFAKRAFTLCVTAFVLASIPNLTSGNDADIFHKHLMPHDGYIDLRPSDFSNAVLQNIYERLENPNEYGGYEDTNNVNNINDNYIIDPANNEYRNEDFNDIVPQSNMAEESLGSVGMDGPYDNNNAIRDEEHLPQSGLWGHQYVQGGAGEGIQSLSPMGLFKNIQDIKTDAFLPTYCDPPNPCPYGYTSDDNCLEDVKNTADFSRDYQSQQVCLCDPEHMFDCPEEHTQFILPPKHSPLNNAVWPAGNLMGKGMSERIANILKNFEPSNPYLTGEKLRTVAKKGKNVY
ncbi:unnamed protein product [Gordionus sp. m RMFG-2023]|uniref:neuroendocrine protein 7B2-like isoform X2 n=1 Tax=Gordionus sp. m RMFG-2023 TaxID=3053472 RepID=UPI0030E226C6